MKRIVSVLFVSAMSMLLFVGIPGFAATSTAPENNTQQRTHAVKGVVSDALGPLAGVNVMVKGTTNGVMTDNNGAYVLQNVAVGSVLEFSFIGYKTSEVTVTESESVNVLMQEDTNLLEELVVIGYGTVKKSDVTGSVASVSGESLAKTSTGDAIQALQGRAAGVQIVTASGSPDATPEIKIRGTGSPNGSDPLFVVDGFPMNNINYLSPNDIASMEILKDASACAIYGSRGANGVVMITTKQAEAGALKVNVKAEFGVEASPKKPDMMSSVQYAEMTNLVRSNSGLAPKYDNPSSITTDTNWYDEVMRTGLYQNYSLTMSGGSDKISTVFTTNYFSREGTVKSTKMNRLNFTQNTVYKPAKFLTIKTSFSGSFSSTNSLGSDGTNNRTIFLSSLIAPPDVPVWNDVTDYYQGISVFRLANPAGTISRNHSTAERKYLIANISGDLTLLPGLVFTSRFGYKYNVSLGNDWGGIYFETSNIASGNSSTYRSTSYTKDWTWENMLTYSKKIKAHEFSVMAAMSARDYFYETYSGSKKNLPSEKKEFRYFDSASDTTPSLSGSARSLGMISYLGRVNYTLLGRYLLTASFRADGSSRFIGGNKWGYFPSAALAWKISEEPFFKNVNPSAISNVKLRLGWGQIGNENISSYYPYITSIRQNQYYVLGENKDRVNGAALRTLGNTDLQWETSEQSNIGLDLAFLDSRLSATFDGYIRKTDNILLSESVPRVSGTGSITRNVGGMKNTGLEISLGWKDDVGDFSYSIDGNVSFVKNKVTDLGTSGILQENGLTYDYALIDFQGQFNNIVRSFVDKPYGQFYGYNVLGVFQDQAEIDAYKSQSGSTIMPDAKPGDTKYADMDGDGKISGSDMVKIGDPNPVAVFGLSLNASYKGFDLSLLFQGTAGNDIFNASKFYFNKFDGRQNILASARNENWTGKGSTNKYPIALAYDSDDARNSRNWWQSTNYIENGSYFRLKNLQLGYTFKPNFGGVKTSMRVYFAAQNLFTITGYSGFDPEVSGNGVDGGQYPQPRTFVLGVNFNL